MFTLSLSFFVCFKIPSKYRNKILLQPFFETLLQQNKTKQPQKQQQQQQLDFGLTPKIESFYKLEQKKC